jgi:hypothetical protein
MAVAPLRAYREVSLTKMETPDHLGGLFTWRRNDIPLVPSDNGPFVRIVTMRGLPCARWRRSRATTGRVFARDNGLCSKADSLAALRVVTDRSDTPLQKV